MFASVGADGSVRMFDLRWAFLNFNFFILLN
jgi:hypothetical protein